MECEREYTLMEELGSGTFGYVFLAKDQKENKYAIKRMKKVSKKLSREIEVLEILKKSRHTVNLIECFYSQSSSDLIVQNMVFEYLPTDLYKFIKENKKLGRNIPIQQIKLICYQIFKGLAELESHKVIHRDIKPENILIDKKGLLKICDFGSAKFEEQSGKNSPYVVSMFYRAPELFLCYTKYNTKIDIWSAGCILGELFCLSPIFKGKNEGDQFFAILRILGNIDKEDKEFFIENADFMKKILNFLPDLKQNKEVILSWVKNCRNQDDKKNAVDLLMKIFVFNPNKRISVTDILKHPFFHDIIEDYNKIIN